MKIEGKEEVTQVRVNRIILPTYLRLDLHTLMYIGTFVAVAVIRFQVWHHNRIYFSLVRSVVCRDTGFPVHRWCNIVIGDDSGRLG